MRLRLHVYPALAVSVFLLAACDAEAPTPTPEPTLPPQAGTPTGGATPQPSTPGSFLPTITYEVSGGLDGMSRVMTIEFPGKASLYDGGKPVSSFKLDIQTWRKLEGLFMAADFYNLQTRYDSESVSDDIYYDITYSRDGRTKSVTVAEIGGLSLAPSALRSIITELDDIEDKVRFVAEPGTPTPTPTPP